MAENKVLYGFKDLYIGTYEVDAVGEVTLGTPYHQKGAVGWSPEEQGESYTFYADDTSYFSYYQSGTFEGDLVVARFDDDFKKEFLGYVELADGGLAQVKNAKKPNIYLMFELQGNEGPERMIYYNGTLGGINREFATIEENIEVQTESIPVKIDGDAETGISKVGYSSDKQGFATLFSAPPAPALPTTTPGN